MSEEDLQALEVLSMQVPDNGLVIEVGTFLGRATWTLCKSVHPSVRVIGIDIFSWLPEHGAFGMTGSAYDQSLTAEAIFDLNTRDCENLTKIVSQSLGYRFAVNSAELVFVDARHDLPWVALDIGYFAAAVAPGGVLAGDDYSEQHDDVRRSVDALAHALKVDLELVGTKLWKITL